MNRSKKLDKQRLYEIFRACRLCGAVTGYRMPIIQNIVQLDEDEIELKEKIRDCLQLEVHSDDKMPPLICENCVDKVDDFYEFLSTCRQTNIKTRKQLGLPLQVVPPPPKVTPTPVKVIPVPTKVPVAKKVVCKDIGTDTCMLGLIELSAVKQDIYIVGKQPDAKKSKGKVKKEENKTEIPVKTEIPPVQKSQSLKDIKLATDKETKKKREASPKRATRQSYNDEVPLSKIQEAKSQPVSKPGPKSRKVETKDDPPPKATRAKEKDEALSKLLKNEVETPKPKSKKEKDNESFNKLKRVKEKDAKPDLTTPPTKKARSSEPPKPSPQTSKSQKSSKPSPKSVQTIPTASKPAQPDGIQCPACIVILKNNSGFTSHMYFAHPVTFTPDNLACNACRLWFPTIEEAVGHHKRHSHYKCQRCHNKFKTGVLYHLHVENKRCVPDTERPDVKCAECRRTFPTDRLLQEHRDRTRCGGGDARLGGKCSKCNRHYSLLKNLVKHESSCGTGKRVRGSSPACAVIAPEVKKVLLRMSVRISRCDDLLQYGPVVSACTVPHRYGLDRKMSYPYLPELRAIKKTTFNPFRAIQDENKEEFGPDDFNWADFENIEQKTVKKLSTLCLKVIFSAKMLGDKEILDEIEIARRLALKKRIDSIIFKVDDASSTNSDSILDINAVAKTFDVVNNEVGSEDNENHSDVTVLDKTSHTGDEDKGSNSEVDDSDRDLINNLENSENLETDDSNLKNEMLSSNILSNSDVDINKVCNTSNLNVEEPSDQKSELNKSLRDDVTCNLEETDSNPTDIVSNIDIISEEKLRFDNVSSNVNPSLNNTENSTNDATKAIESDSLSKCDVNHSNEKLLVNSTITENTSLSSNIVENNETNIDCENTVNKNRPLTDSVINFKSMDGDDAIDTPCGIEIANPESTTTVSDSLETVSKSKTEINNEHSADSSKNNHDIKNTILNTKNNSDDDLVPNKNEIKTTSPQKANKSVDFSVTGILNHVTSKTDTKQDVMTGKDKINENNELSENSSLNISLCDKHNSTNSNSIINNEKHDNINIQNTIGDDSTSLNSISTTFTEKTNDNLSLNTDGAKVEKSDRYNETYMSEEENKLMAELDEQIGETNDKIDKLNETRDLNYDGYQFD